MFDCFLAHSIVLIMLFFCCARVFFIKNARIDSFAAFAPISLFISVCTLFCFDFYLITLAIFILSLLVFFTNFRAVLRLAAKLVVDTYSPVFIVFSIVLMIVTVLLSAVVFWTRPVRYTPQDFSAVKKEYTLSGSLSNLSVRESFFSGEKFSGKLYLYEPEPADDISEDVYAQNPLLIFSPGLRANVINYEPYFLILAQKGYRVLAADLFTPETQILSKNAGSSTSKTLVESKTFRRFAAIHLAESNPEEFNKVLELERPLASKKYSALTKLALELFGDETKVFYIVDGVDFDSIYSVIDEFNTEPYTNAKGFFSMNRVDEYKTGGYGFIEQTDVFLAYGKKIERENKFFIPRYVANKTMKAITESK